MRAVVGAGDLVFALDAELHGGGSGESLVADVPTKPTRFGGTGFSPVPGVADDGPMRAKCVQDGGDWVNGKQLLPGSERCEVDDEFLVGPFSWHVLLDLCALLFFFLGFRSGRRGTTAGSASLMQA